MLSVVIALTSNEGSIFVLSKVTGEVSVVVWKAEASKVLLSILVVASAVTLAVSVKALISNSGIVVVAKAEVESIILVV